MPAEKEPVFRRYDPKQTLILPPDPNEWLPPNHLARIVAHVVDDDLDLAPLVASFENEEGGRPAFHPRMLLKVVLYGYCVGVGSSRKLEKATYEDRAIRCLATDQHPHFTSLARFRRKCLPLMDGLFHPVLELCREVGLLKLGRVALDGTKIKASASKHKSKSYRKIVEEERDLRAVARRIVREAEEASSVRVDFSVDATDRYYLVLYAYGKQDDREVEVSLRARSQH